MADGKENRNCAENKTFLKIRHQEKQSQDAYRSKKYSQHKSIQTETTPTRHAGVQYEPPPSTDMEITDGNTMDCSDTLTTSPSAVNLVNSSGTQIGGENSIVNNNNTYHITNNNTYNIYSNCDQCHPSQHDDIIQALESGSSPHSLIQDVANQELTSLPMTEVKSVVRTARSEPHTSSDSEDPAQTLVTPTSKSFLQSSDVKSLDTCTEQGKSNEMKLAKQGNQYRSFDSKLTSVEPRQSTEDDVFYTDLLRPTKPGDTILFKTGDGCECAVYAGNRQMVRCKKTSTGWKVVKEEFFPVIYANIVVSRKGDGVMYNRTERLARAESLIGGCIVRGDFIYWVWTGLSWEEGMKKGFVLSVHQNHKRVSEGVVACNVVIRGREESRSYIIHIQTRNGKVIKKIPV